MRPGSPTTSTSWPCSPRASSTIRSTVLRRRWAWDNWVEIMRWQVLRQYGLSTEDLTVTFDHVTHDAEFQVNYGRKIRREEDGFYHVTPLEWESFRGMQGVAL